MMNTTKIAAFAAVVAILGIAAWIFLSRNAAVNETPPAQTPATSESKTNTPSSGDSGQLTGQVIPAGENGSGAAADESMSIDQDLSSIDAQLQALDEDNAGIDAGLSDNSDLVPVQ